MTAEPYCPTPPDPPAVTAGGGEWESYHESHCGSCGRPYVGGVRVCVEPLCVSHLREANDA